MAKKVRRKKTQYNAMAVFERPFKVEGKDVYGLLLYVFEDEDLERHYIKTKEYLYGYMMPASQMWRKGRCEKGKWFFPDYGIEVTQDLGLDWFLRILFDELLGFTIIRTGDIKCSKGEADEDFILSKNLIDRYYKQEKQDNTQNI